jgi:crotonyl-CoA carboxylase/reductase
MRFDFMNPKDLYEIGEEIPLGHVPQKMYAFGIKTDEHGRPKDAFKELVVDTPHLEPHEVLVQVMAAGVNYNGVWLSLGEPVSPKSFHGQDIHIGGSDASAIVWKIGEALKDNPQFPYKIGDEVVIHCGQFCGLCEECNGGDPMLCQRLKIWGYETPHGSFAQFSVVRPQQLMPKPKHLSWGESAGHASTLATAWRMLYGYPPHHLKAGQNVLIWGAAGGLGCYAIQIVANAGANAIAVVSTEEKGEYCLRLGARAYINHSKFDCWGELPPIENKQNYKRHFLKIRKFEKALWEITGKGVNPDIVFEHVGCDTFPVSCYIVKRGGLVVYCGATSGLRLTLDAAYGWLYQKRIQGSHFASSKDAKISNHEVICKKINPCVSKKYEWKELPLAHQAVYENIHPLGKSVVLIQAKFSEES